jgi:zinc D-Ala-D-Ala carboxypeptidase
MRLTRNFSLEQLIYSETALRAGIDNTPDPAIVKNLRRLAKGLERVQAITGFPLEISSGYRCAELNRRVGGAKNSQHTQGLAADFTCAEFGSPVDVIKAIRSSGINFDQCILEYAKWVHISFSKAPRGKVLTIYDPRQGYLDGLWDKGGKEIA